MPKLSHWLWLSGWVIVLDQLSKLWMSHHFVYGEQLPVINGLFSLVLAHNTGAAFSFLSEAGGLQRWLFTAIALAASAWMFSMLRKQYAKVLFSLAISLILGGALGNLIDRIAYGYVIDFLLFYWQSHYFPAFNLADSAITLGAILLFFDGFKKEEHGTAAG